MTNNKNLSKLQKIIPEFHFDLISRIVPGFVLLFLMAQWAVGDRTPADAGKTLFNPSLQWTWTSGLLVIPLSYVLGLFCSAISRLVSWPAELIIWRTISKEDRKWTSEQVQALLKTEDVDYNSRQFMRLFDPIHDYLKERKESQSTLLSKLVAEVGFFYTLCTGLALFALA